jgi:hypothetical protein
MCQCWLSVIKRRARFGSLTREQGRIRCQEEMELGRRERAQRQDVGWDPARETTPPASRGLEAEAARDAGLDSGEVADVELAAGEDRGGSLTCLTTQATKESEP